MEILKLKDYEDNKKQNIKVLVYGDSLVGKTRLAATFPKPLIISTDGNFKGLEGVNIDAQAAILSDYMEKTTDSGIVMKESGWIQFKQLIDVIEKADIDTVVVDLVKDVYDFARQVVLKKLGVEHESEDKRMGRVWSMIDTEFLPTLRKLMTSSKNVVLIAHAKERDGFVIPDLIDSLVKKIIKYTDIVGLLSNEKDLKGNVTRTFIAVPEVRKITGNRLGITEKIVDPDYDKIIESIERGK